MTFQIKKEKNIETSSNSSTPSGHDDARPRIPPRKNGTPSGSAHSYVESSLDPKKVSSPPKTPPLSPLPLFAPPKKKSPVPESSPTPSKSSIPYADEDEKSISPKPDTPSPKIEWPIPKSETSMSKATPLLAITHPSVDTEPEPKKEISKPETPKPSPPRSPAKTPGKGVSVISGKCVSGWL